MILRKVTCAVTVEVLSKDAIPAMLYEAASRIREECVMGQLCHDDGDSVTWSVQVGDENVV
jgi:hypothetical protein